MKELKEKGITLIALVVTIIILLILAGVTLNIALSDNGLFKRAQEGAERYKLAQTNEEELVSSLETEMNNYGGTEKGKNDQEDKNKAKEDKSYVGYYADLDGDPTTAEGIIYADLAVGKDGEWKEDSGNAKYSYKTTTGLKSYVIGDTIKSEKFGNKELQIISGQKDTSGKNRFYVMALEDLGNEDYYWYYGNFGELDRVEDPDTDIEFGENEPKGMENTTYMIEFYKSHGRTCW